MRILFLITIVFLFFKTEACDGCNISTGFINIDPVNYFSFRHRNIQYDGEEIPFFRHSGGGGELHENFINYEFVAKYFVIKNIFFQTFISMKQTIISSEDIDETTRGFSDPIFLIGYQKFDVFKKWQLNYSFFGGCDIGIGRYETKLDEEYSPGSKTTDLLMGSEFLARFSKWAIISKSNYKIGYENKHGYRFGQTVNSSIYGGYYHEKGNFITLPLLGFSFESDFIDYNNSQSVKFSCSDIFFADIGLNLMLNRKFVFGTKYKIPVFKNVPGWSDVKLNSFEFEMSIVIGD